MEMLRFLGGSSLARIPPISSSPSLMSSSPATMRIKVVLPQPLGPTSTTNSPSAMSRSTPCTTWMSPNRLMIPINCTAAMSVPQWV
jgi:hypothetical protein